MLKHKKFLSTLLVLPLFASFSCAQAKDTYNIKKNGDEGNLLVLEATPEKWSQPIEAPFELNFDGLKVKFDETYLNVLAKNIDEAKEPLSYFICTSDTVPSKSIINNYQVAWTNAQVNTQLNFYIAHLDNNDIHLSNKITINVINKGAFAGPWVIPVITIGIALIVVAMVFFTHRYKAKKEGK